MADIPAEQKPDILAALRLMITAVFHLGDAHEISTTGVSMGVKVAVANAKSALNSAAAMLDTVEGASAAAPEPLGVAPPAAEFVPPAETEFAPGEPGPDSPPLPEAAPPAA